MKAVVISEFDAAEVLREARTDRSASSGAEDVGISANELRFSNKTVSSLAELAAIVRALLAGATAH
ncbi:hypothetical protein ABH935_004465 [Catenulispora sp. GAS73]|uniref:hypothetical protein n=1 Tax=Catenulispora sp. GAS73 TaxID=3156269 RepID=UPI003512D188